MRIQESIQLARRRIEKQIVLFHQNLDSDHKSSLLVVYGPFPHNIELDFEPLTYQVLWTSHDGQSFPKCDEEGIVAKIEDETKVLMWISFSNEKVQNFVKKYWNIDLTIPSFVN